MNHCPPTDRLEGFLGECLPDPEREAVAAHLEACPACQRQAELLLGATPTPHLSEKPLASDTALHEPRPEFLRWLKQQRPTPAPWQSGGGTPPAVPGYEILSLLGRGGMGVVYKARQVAADRVIALKMILHGIHADDEVLQRFRSEAQAVARLQHPNIVQVHEVGECAGVPYFSLEFCGGGSLDKKLAGTPLPPGEAAALAETLAQAMQAAHQRGIVHRDLKPANVLLAQDGTPKVTDFGLAKRLDGAGQTATGQVMGTPSYMAPEQAAGKGKEVGPAADVYALGAILYECLTGRPPFKGPTPLDTLYQVIHDDPVPPRQLNKRLPRDLETVCLKCLAKDPPKRYRSMAELADDLGRFQRGEPVRARPLGRLGRGWRWCRRRPAVAGLLALVLVLAGGAFTAVTALWLRAERARDDADRQRVAAEGRLGLATDAVGTYLDAVTEDGDLRKSDFHPLRKRLLESAVPFYRKLAEERPGDARQQAARGRAYGRLGAIYHEMGAHEQALEAVDERLAIFRQLATDFPGEIDYRREQLQAHLQRGVVLRQLGRLGEARRANEEALRLGEETARERGDEPPFLSDLADAQNNLAVELKSQGDLKGAARLLAEAEGRYGRAAEAAADGTKDRNAQARTLANLGEILERSGNPAAARDALDKALRLRRDLLARSPGSPEQRNYLAAVCNTMGIVCRGLRDLPAARQIHEEALALRTQLAAEFPSVPGYRQNQAASHNNLGAVLFDLDDRAGVRQHIEAAHAIKEKLAKDFPLKPVYQQDLALSYSNLGEVLLYVGDKAAARQAIEQALRIRQDLTAAYPGVPDYRKDLITGRCNLGQALEALGDAAGALKAYRDAADEADQLVKDSPGAAAHHALQGYAHKLVADRYKQDEKYAEALPAYDRAIDILAKAKPSGGEVDARKELRLGHQGRAEVLHRLGRHDEAEAAWEQALALTPPAGQWALRYARATALGRAGRFAPAAAAVEELVRAPETTPVQHYDAACLLARLATDVKDSADEPGVRERYASRCVELLRRAQAKGFFKASEERERLRTSPDFDALRGREDFRKLLDEVANKAPASGAGSPK